MSQYPMLLVGLVSSLIWACSFAGPIEEKWGVPLEGPFGLKQYVVSILAAKTQPDLEKQKLKVAKPTADLLSVIDIMPLLYVYDSLGSDRDIEDLASLSPYYLGESAGTLYRCLLLRKGRKIQPILEKLAATKANECIQRFGLGSNICLPEKEYRASLKSYTEKISALSKSGETTPSCTTTGWSSM
jgi:hypothetical protein